MKSLKFLIEDCLKRKPDSFRKFVSKTLEEASKRLGPDQAKIVSTYELAFQHFDHLKGARDFWSWFELLSARASSGSTSNDEDLLEVIVKKCNSTLPPRRAASLRERLATLALNGWVWAVPLLSATWLSQHRYLFNLTDAGPSVILVTSLIWGFVLWAVLSILIRPFWVNLRTDRLHSAWSWILVPLASLVLVVTYAIFLFPMTELVKFLDRGGPSDGIWLRFKNLDSLERHLALAMDLSVASVGDIWILALLPCSFLLLALSRWLHRLAPWTTAKRVRKRYYLLWVPSILLFLWLSYPLAKLLIPFTPDPQLAEEIQQSSRWEAPPLEDSEIKRALEEFQRARLDASLESETIEQAWLRIREPVFKVEGWTKLEPALVREYGLAHDPHPRSTWEGDATVAAPGYWEPLKGGLATAEIRIRQMGVRTARSRDRHPMQVAELKGGSAEEWSRLRKLLAQQKGLEGPALPSVEERLHEVSDYLAIVFDDDVLTYRLRVDRPNFLWTKAFIVSNLQQKWRERMWAEEKRLLPQARKNEALTLQEQRALKEKSSSLSGLGPSWIRLTYEQDYRCLVLLDFILYAKIERAAGRPLPNSLKDYPSEMYARIQHFEELVQYELGDDGKPLFVLRDLDDGYPRVKASVE